MQSTFKEMTRRAFFDKSLVESNLPNVPVLYISCRRSIWYCAWAAYKFRELYEQHLSKGDTVRPIHFTYLDDGNHFVSDLDFLWIKMSEIQARPIWTFPTNC